MVARTRGQRKAIPIESLFMPVDTQIRTDGLNADHIRDLAEADKAGEKLPPVQVRICTPPGQDKPTHVLTDGFHTVQARILNGRKTVPAEVRIGTWVDAIFDAANANIHSKSPLKRTHADKQRALSALLWALQESKQDWTAGLIADHIGTSRSFVYENMPKEMPRPAEGDTETPPPARTKRLGRDGKKYSPRKPAAAKDDKPAPFDWKGMQNAIAYLARGIQAANELLGLDKTPHYEKLRVTLTRFDETFEAVRKTYDKKGR